MQVPNNLIGYDFSSNNDVKNSPSLARTHVPQQAEVELWQSPTPSPLVSSDKVLLAANTIRPRVGNSVTPLLMEPETVRASSPSLQLKFI